VSSDESRGNHLGDSYLYAGVFGDVIFHGLLQFDLSSVPRGATIYGAVLEISGLDARRLGDSGVWEMRVLEREIDSGWSRHTYQDIHNADVQWTLPPALGVEDLAADQTNAFELSREQLQDLEQRLLDEHYWVSFRIDGPLVGQNSVFAWDSGYGPATLERRPLLLLNVGAPPETPIPTGSPPPTNTPTPSLTPTPSATPTPTNTPEWVVITSTPTPENVVTAAAVALRETAWATTTGTATAMPEFVATPTPSYFVVTNTPTPMNRATAIHQRAVATAHIILTGTPTPPLQPLITATPTPWPTITPAVVWFDLTTITPTPTTTPQPTVPALPPVLTGKILFLSDRSGEPELYVLDPATGRLGLLTAQWPYDLAERSEILSPDERSFVYVQDDERRVPQIYIYSREYSDSRQVTFNTGMSYDPAWSPSGDRLAFVSTEGGNDDIYVVGTDGQGMARLTVNEWEWDQHPSWSPDGTQIVFWSNRDSGRKQLWIMNADGSGQRLLLESEHNDWDPVWGK
jgi:dipeptidyl aminopeptidase/acylaminoacyl peptidase